MCWTLPFFQALVICIVHICTDGIPLHPRDGTDDKSIYIDGDIRLAEVNPYQNTRIAFRSAVRDKAKTWTRGIVPYVIDTTFFSSDQLRVIEAAINVIQEKTCIHFVLRNDQVPYLFITTLSRCWSEIGMPPDEGIRTLSLGSACTDQRGTVVHELLHILGFWHEHNRPDRDDYVTIQWENVLEGFEHNFAKYSTDKVDTLNEPYDYDSIMHYSAYAFTKDPLRPTIEAKIPRIIGQRFGLSLLDVRKINKLYNCSSLAMEHHSVQAPSENQNSAIQQQTDDTNHKIVFPSITELVPLPFRYNWSSPQPGRPMPDIVFPSS